MPVEDIISSIGDDIEVGTRPLDPGLSNLGRVNVTGTEDNVPGEGTIFYDIRFTAYIEEEKMKILLNMEAQRSSNAKKLGYHLENRIIFICMDSKRKEDSIEEIGLDRKTVFEEHVIPADIPRV